MIMERREWFKSDHVIGNDSRVGIKRSIKKRLNTRYALRMRKTLIVTHLEPVFDIFPFLFEQSSQRFLQISEVTELENIRFIDLFFLKF